MSNEAIVSTDVMEELKKIGSRVNGYHKMLAQQHFGVPGNPMSNRTLDRYLSGKYNPQDTSAAEELLSFFLKCLQAQEVADKAFDQELEKLVQAA